MKRKIYAGLSLTLIGMALIACKKEVTQEVKTEPKVEKPMEERIGEFHNFALDLYYQNGHETATIVNFEDVRNEVVTLLTEANEELFQLEEIQSADFQKLDRVTSELSFFKRSEERDALDPEAYDFDLIMANLVATGAISPMAGDALTNVNVLVLSEAFTSDEILMQVNALNDMPWGATDAYYIAAFVDVYNASSVYWNDPANIAALPPAQQAMAIDDTDKVIIADAVGALHGLILGPVLSIIEGAAFSIYANHNL